MSEEKTEIEELIKKQVKKQLKEKLKELDTKKSSYDGWIVSNSLFKRSLAVMGHYFLGYLILLIPIVIITIIFIGIGGMFGSDNESYKNNSTNVQEILETK